MRKLLICLFCLFSFIGYSQVAYPVLRGDTTIGESALHYSWSGIFIISPVDSVNLSNFSLTSSIVSIPITKRRIVDHDTLYSKEIINLSFSQIDALIDGIYKNSNLLGLINARLTETSSSKISEDLDN